jgi:hypothetical protein
VHFDILHGNGISMLKTPILGQLQVQAGRRIRALKTVVKSLKNVLSVDETYAFVLKQSGEPIGSIGLILSKNETNCTEMEEVVLSSCNQDSIYYKKVQKTS